MMLGEPHVAEAKLSAACVISMPRPKISCEERNEGDCMSKKVPMSMVIPGC